MKTTLRDIVLAVRYGDAALVGESAGYLVLGVADLCAEIPRRVSLDSVYVDDDGVVGIDASPCTFQEAEASHRQVLSLLLQLVRTPCPNLERVAGRQETRGIDGLVAELESALVPVNRRAAKRSMARLVREAKKATARMGVLAEVAPVPAAPADVVEVPAVSVPSSLASFEELEVDVQELESDTPTVVAPRTAQAPVELVADLVASSSQQEIALEAAAAAPAKERSAAIVSSQTVESRYSSTSAHKPSSAAMELLAKEYCAHTPVGGRSLEVAGAPASPPVRDLSVFTRRAPAPVVPESLVVPARSIEALSEQDVVAIQDELDDAPTQIFAAAHVEERVRSAEPVSIPTPTPPTVVPAPNELEVVARISPSVESRMAVSAPPKLTESPIPPSTTRMREPLPASLSLIPDCAKSPARRPSDIQELLDRVPTTAQPDDELYAGLKLLSRIDLSPIAPPVAWLESKA